MDIVTIAFDMDGTLLGPNDQAVEDVRSLMRILAGFKNTRIIVWSGSGEMYARLRAQSLHINHWVDDYCAKGAVKADIAIDDVEITKLGVANLICASAGD